jgi:hypothetical protein
MPAADLFASCYGGNDLCGELPSPFQVLQLIRIWGSVTARASRPRPGRRRRFVPALLGRQQVGVAGVLLDLGQVLDLSSLELDRWTLGHEVVLAAGDEQQRRPVVVLVVDEGVLAAGFDGSTRLLG